MKLIHAIILASLVIVFSGCSTIKAARYIKNGSVNQRTFKTEVAFEMRFGLIILKVKIHGKEYNFILDSGAPTAISKELAKQLGVKVIGSGKVSDSQGNSGNLGYTVVDSIGINDLQFLKTGAVLVDLQSSAELTCFKADGIIGANLMEKAIWQFDYVRQIITIASSLDSLSIPANAKKVKFHPAFTGTPFIDVQMNGITDHNVVVDLGSNADFYSSEKTLEMLQQNGLQIATYSYGVGATGLYGKAKPDTTAYAIISSIGLDSLQLTNQVVTFLKKGTKSIGTNFFKNYRLIIDWSSKELTMIPVHHYDNTLQKLYNFNFVLKDQHIFIGTVYASKDPAKDGPQLGDQVLEIDGKDYRTCTGDNWCELLTKHSDNPPTGISLLVKRGDKELSFMAVKEAQFLKK